MRPSFDPRELNVPPNMDSSTIAALGLAGLIIMTGWGIVVFWLFRHKRRLTSMTTLSSSHTQGSSKYSTDTLPEGSVTRIARYYRSLISQHPLSQLRANEEVAVGLDYASPNLSE